LMVSRLRCPLLKLGKPSFDLSGAHTAGSSGTRRCMRPPGHLRLCKLLLLHYREQQDDPHLLGGVPASLPAMLDAGECGRGVDEAPRPFFKESSRPKPPLPVDPASL
jgi:hypothetical protein